MHIVGYACRVWEQEIPVYFFNGNEVAIAHIAYKYFMEIVEARNFFHTKY